MSAIKIGVLLPASTLYPLIGSDFITGIKTCLTHSENLPFELIIENIGFGGIKKDIFGSAEKMLLEKDADIVIAFINSNIAHVLDPLFEAHQKILVVVDTGGNIPTSNPFSAFRFTISLQAAFGSCLTGRLAAEEGRKKTIFATSFYEGGYQQCNAYQQGLLRAGGITLGHFVTPFKQDIKIEQLGEKIANHKPDAILAQFSAEAGAAFLKEFTQAHLNELVKVYASPFMLEEGWLSTVSFPFEGISGCVSWSRKLSNETNKLFLDTIKTTAGKQGNIFSMLGWEVAQFISAVVIEQSKNKNDILKTIPYIETLCIKSPRGILQMNPNTHFFLSAMYNATIISDRNNKCELSIAGEIDFALNELHHFNEDYVSTSSGWTNTYLCI